MLEVKGIWKSYGKKTALYPVRFVLPPGQCLGLVGENGSGKSTLLRLLAQVEAPDGGEIWFRGKNVLGDRQFLRRSVGYVPQEDGLLPELKVGRQLALWQRACGLRGGVSEEILDLLGLMPLWNKPVSELSGGMRRRVSIAMALLAQPEILLMDEATAGLDEHYRRGLILWLRSFLEAGGRMIWCSHDSWEIEQLCGSCVRLKEGKIEESET